MQLRLPTISMSADEYPLTLKVVEAGFSGCTPLYDAAPLALHAPRMLDCMYAQQILLLAWPPRPMPVRQSWVESVLASGGYGSYSIQRHLYFLSLRAGQRAPAAAAAADTAFLRYSCTVCMSAHSTHGKALRRSCTISRFLEKLHELRFASPTLLPRLLYSTVMYHIDIHRR